MTEAQIRKKFESIVRASKGLFPLNALAVGEDGSYEDTYTCYALLGFAAGYVMAREEAKEGAAIGWIDWRGGALPLEKGTSIEVRHRSGETLLSQAGFGVASEWGHFDDDADIVAYRVI